MRAQRKSFGFREDAIKWLRDQGFTYHEKVGWQHPKDFRAIVEFGPPNRWALCVYKSTFQPTTEITR